jgi:dienelactone hydrolase
MKVEPVRYTLGSNIFSGALVYDETVTQPRPAVLMAPNWMGVTDAAIERAKLLASDRYVMFVADMYGEGKRPANFEQAAALADPLRADPAEDKLRIRAAFDSLLGEGSRRRLIDERRAAIGFCFGGGNVLDLARSGAELHAVVSIHGDLKTRAPAGRGDIKAALLVVHGAQDPVVPKADRDAFEDEMTAAGAKWQMLVFGELLHAFTDQGADIATIAAYDEPAARQTYVLTHAFLADAFAGRT